LSALEIPRKVVSGLRISKAPGSQQPFEESEGAPGPFVVAASQNLWADAQVGTCTCEVLAVEI